MSDTILTATDLEHLTTLERAATAAPWQSEHYARGWEEYFGEGHTKVGGASMYDRIFVRDERWTDEDGTEQNDGGKTDAEFIPAIRNAAPSLLANLVQARSLLARLVKDSPWEDFSDHYDCRYCFVRTYPGPDFGKEGHHTNCLWLTARAHLWEAGVEIPA